MEEDLLNEGTFHRQTHTNIAYTRLNWPRGRFSEKSTLNMHPREIFNFKLTYTSVTALLLLPQIKLLHLCSNSSKIFSKLADSFWSTLSIRQKIAPKLNDHMIEKSVKTYWLIVSIYRKSLTSIKLFMSPLESLPRVDFVLSCPCQFNTTPLVEETCIDILQCRV